MLDRLAPRPRHTEWDLAAESIAVKIRWFGLVVGLLIANAAGPVGGRASVNALLALGAVYTVIDTLAFRRGRVFLRDFPLLTSALESLFIGLLCLAHTGAASPFRYYYLLSLVCCASRHAPRTTVLTCGLGLLSHTAVYLATPRSGRDPELFALTLVVLVWVTWAAAAMARILKRAGERLRALNAELTDNQALLETRIAERTRDLESSQAQVLHGEKMAAFGLLAAGIAHEVGNPLTSISNIVQMLERRDLEPYTQDKLRLVTAELARIRTTLRELVTFSRPASGERSRVAVAEVVSDALRLAKYYTGGQSRRIVATIDADTPDLVGVRDQFLQVVFNLVLNAIDATAKHGSVEVSAARDGERARIVVGDDGPGVAPEHRADLFRPYFTTKKHGTGLGLFVIRRIVEGYGGTVAARKRPRARGAVRGRTARRAGGCCATSAGRGLTAIASSASPAPSAHARDPRRSPGRR